ncbi:MAG: cytochrome b [Alphaproteobacteria bacterium]|nr:cytochrome b [Alphaproteobacteria bacterium]
MSGPSTYTPKNGFTKWMDSRLPILRLVNDSFVDYPTPRNLNYWWTFGAILSFMLVVQIVTGVVLAMNYVPTAAMAFDSVEFIRRDVNWGRIIQSAHAVGASMFFAAVYIHIFRGIYYGSYKAPREILWILGVVIFLLMMATGFLGYVLPWGQMSFWAATVITSFFSAIPLVGDGLVQLIRGGLSIDNATLTRFYSLHYLLPFMIVGVVGLHIWALHVPGNGNPAGVEVKDKKDVLPFHPYYTMKDLFALVVFLLPFAWFMFFAPDALGHPDNYIVADSQVTPLHIVPEWYFMPFYAILRAITFNIGIPFTDIVLINSKLGGVIAMFGAIIVLFFLPWLDSSKVRSGSFRPVFKGFYLLLVISFIGLGWLGSKPADGIYVILAQGFTAYYFGYFLIILPILGKIETTRPLPNSISESVLGPSATREPAAATMQGAE